MRQIISFDFDGVLVKSPFGYRVLFPLIQQLAEAHARSAGVPLEQSQKRARDLAWAEFRRRTASGEYLEAYNWEEIIHVVARELGGRLERSVNEMNLEVARELERTGDRSLVYPHAHEILEALARRGACLLLLTNGFRCYQLPMAEALGLAPFFHAILASDDLGSVKPFREAFERAYARCGRRPGEPTYHVGDTLKQDVLGAHLVGARAVWIHRDLPDGIRRLPPLERPGAPELRELLRGKAAREEANPPGAEGAESTEELLLPDAVIASLEELKLAIPAG